jgi:putative ABC transport system ATP-binding protein
MLGTLPTLTVAENLALAEMRATGAGFGRALSAARRGRYAAALSPFGLGLEARLESRVGLLSGGQRQVLALAMAVVSTPRVLLLDEHCAALDPKTAELVMTATVRAVSDGRLTTLMVTHNMQHAIRYGDRLLMMDAGKVLLDVRGEEKRRLTVDALVERFHLAADRMLLA